MVQSRPASSSPPAAHHPGSPLPADDSYARVADAELERVLTSFDTCYVWRYGSVQEGLRDLYAKAKIDAKARAAFFVQDYSGSPRIDGVELVALKRFNDDGGAITELGRLTAGAHAQLEGFEVKQVNYSEMEPGACKAFHMHFRQTDVWYVPPSDKLLLVLHDCRADSPTAGQTMRFVLGDGNSRRRR